LNAVAGPGGNSIAGRTELRVQTDDFDVGVEIARLRAGNPAIGAVASFIGVCRDLNEGDRVADMVLEHYPGMTERALEAIAVDARSRWDLIDILIVHRVGRMLPTDQIVFVAVTSGHRGEAFAACEFLMDYLKTRAPFWKKEQTADGARWVDARADDNLAADRWK